MDRTANRIAAALNDDYTCTECAGAGTVKVRDRYAGTRAIYKRIPCRVCDGQGHF